MPDYVKKGTGTTGAGDEEKQVPGPLPDNAYDRAVLPATASFFKTPNAVLIGNLTQKVGFFFGSSASFSEKDSDGVGPAGPSGMLSSSHYTSFGKPAQGTILNIHPTAWSGSLADDKDKAITLIYKSGLSTGGF